MNNPYNVLGLPVGSKIEDVKKARRRLCAVHHPDNGGDKEIFDRINKAYDTIINGKTNTHTIRPTRRDNRSVRHVTLFNLKVV